MRGRARAAGHRVRESPTIRSRLNRCTTCCRAARPRRRAAAGSWRRRRWHRPSPLRQRRHQPPRQPVVDELGIAADTGRDHGQSARHRFQNRVRNALGQRWQHEAVEAAQDGRDVGHARRAASEFAKARGGEHATASARSGPSPTITRRIDRGRRAALHRTNERVRQRDRIFTACMRPTVPTSQWPESLNGQPSIAAARRERARRSRVSTPL